MKNLEKEFLTLTKWTIRFLDSTTPQFFVREYHNVFEHRGMLFNEGAMPGSLDHLSIYLKNVDKIIKGKNEVDHYIYSFGDKETSKKRVYEIFDNEIKSLKRVQKYFK